MRISKEMQEKVDRYVEIYDQMKELESEVKGLRKQLEPYMHEKGVAHLNASNGKGGVAIEPRNMANITANFSSYSPDVVSLLDPDVAKECVVEVVDREKLEALVALGKAPKNVKDYKTKKVVDCFVRTRG